MGTLERLGAADLRQSMVGYRDALRSHQEAINRLNVYPVPDGDTGTNMALTIESVLAELGQLGGEPDMAATCRAIGHGSLMGARGNSGVILSQILRGISDTLASTPWGGAGEVATALVEAASAARGAVMRPVEGTILTVADEVGRAARTRADAGGVLIDVLDAAKAAGAEALARTPALLPVLAEAGVVDAGGAGFLLLVDALLLVVGGRPLPPPPPVAAAASGLGSAGRDGERRTGHEEVGGLRYEVMYLLEAPDESMAAFKDVWAGLGDSIVVVGGEGTWNCHIHTDDVGAAIEAALDAGRPRRIRVTDLAEQVEEERWVREAPEVGPGDEFEPVGPPPRTAVVAVATGEGIRRIFRSLGVHQLVAGGQSMNPSTAQILEAVERVPAQEVVVLPNNDNIVPVAEQVDGLSTKTVRVVPTSGIAEGFAALLEYDPEAGVEDNAESMTASARRVVSGEVTRAIRASASVAGPIAEGNWLGLSAQGIEVVADDLAEAACSLLAKLVASEHEIVTLIEGEGSSPADTRRITEWLSEHRPGATAEVHHGGQPLYPYLFSIE
jgi:DAK2 domain fusion protein YloV